MIDHFDKIPCVYMKSPVSQTSYLISLASFEIPSGFHGIRVLPEESLFVIKWPSRLHHMKNWRVRIPSTRRKDTPLQSL
ncbi:hypothetical protein V6N13_124163 [Hibiscus sabdariffa]